MSDTIPWNGTALAEEVERRSGTPAAERSVGPIAQSREAFGSTGSGRKFGTCSGIANRSKSDTRNRRGFRSEFSNRVNDSFGGNLRRCDYSATGSDAGNCSCAANFRDHNHRRAGCQQARG